MSNLMKPNAIAMRSTVAMPAPTSGHHCASTVLGANGTDVSGYGFAGLGFAPTSRDRVEAAMDPQLWRPPLT